MTVQWSEDNLKTSPSTVWDLGIELWSSGLSGSTLKTNHLIVLCQNVFCYLEETSWWHNLGNNLEHIVVTGLGGIPAINRILVLILSITTPFICDMVEKVAVACSPWKQGGITHTVTNSI